MKFLLVFATLVFMVSCKAHMARVASDDGFGAGDNAFAAQNIVNRGCRSLSFYEKAGAAFIDLLDFTTLFNVPADKRLCVSTYNNQNHTEVSCQAALLVNLSKITSLLDWRGAKKEDFNQIDMVSLSNCKGKLNGELREQVFREMRKSVVKQAVDFIKHKYKEWEESANASLVQIKGNINDIGCRKGRWSENLMHSLTEGFMNLNRFFNFNIWQDKVQFCHAKYTSMAGQNRIECTALSTSRYSKTLIRGSHNRADIEVKYIVSQCKKIDNNVSKDTLLQNEAQMRRIVTEQALNTIEHLDI